MITALVLGAMTAAPEKIPDLKPVRGTIPPSFWEIYGWLIVLLAGVACLALAVLMKRLRRPRPVIVPSAADLARRELERLRASTDEPSPIAAIARVLRHFLIAKFRLSGPGLTTGEIATHLRTNPGLATELHAFLAQCDVASFAPAPTPPLTLAMIADAERLIENIEHQTPPPLPAMIAR